MTSKNNYPNSTNQQSPFLPYALDYIPDELQRKAKIELHEDEETRVRSLALFRELLKKEKDLEVPDDDVVFLAFLRTKKFDVKQSLRLMKNSFGLMRRRSELFYNFDFGDVTRVLEPNGLGVLPHRDRDGCAIMVLRVGKWSPPIQTLGDVMRVLACIIIHSSLCPATQIAGYKVIFDIEGLNLHHIPHISPTYLWMLGEALHNHFPARFKAVYLVNVNHLFSYIWAIIKKCLSKKLKDRCHFFGKGETIKKLHQHLDPRILPAEYKGKLPPFEDVNKEWTRMITEAKDQISEIFAHGYWKSRPVQADELKKIGKEIKSFKLK